jgi:hypothetical protein
MNAAKRRRRATRVLIGLAGLVAVGALFWYTLDTSRAEAYAVRPEHLEGWVLSAPPPGDPDSPRLVLQPPAELPMRLFRQVFSRTAESLSTPTVPGVAFVLGREIEGARVSADVLLAIGRDAGLDRMRLSPRCMAYRRESQPGSTRQIYFVVFDMPQFARLRRDLAARIGSASAARTFDPDALSPVMPLAAQPDFSRWMPIVADPDRDCVAPIVVEP